MKKFTLALATLALSVVSMNAAEYGLAGGFNGWSADANMFTETSTAGVYELTVEKLAGEILVTDGTWNAKWGSGTGKIANKTPYGLVSGGGNIELSDAALTNVTVTLNTNDWTLTLDGTAGEMTYAYGIHGDIFGDPKWSTENMTEANGKWTLTSDIVAGNFGIKRQDPDNRALQLAWIAADGAADVTLNTPLAAKINGTNWSISEGKYAFTFDPEAMSLIVAEGAAWNEISADENATFAIYTIEGNLVKASANMNDVENLENGMYIINGGKVMICK